MAQQIDVPGGISDDMTIAQKLLRQPKIPRRRYSFGSAPPIPDLLDGGNLILDPNDPNKRRITQSSSTWTDSSGDALSDQDEVEDRDFFVHEYNRLAKKHGVRLFTPDDYNVDSSNSLDKSCGWFSRTFLRRTSSTHSIKPRAERQLKHKRSISDLAIRPKPKKDTLKDKDLKELVRLCGLSNLYLPPEYAPGSLAVPTCFRATAQYLVQYGSTTRGIFRIPGSQNVVAALYNYYCTVDQEGEVIAGTVRCPTLPDHIKCDVHDVASAFKRFLSGVPGGILGSLPLFEVLVSIQNQLHGDPELPRTKQSKVRARLIALAVATLRSRYRRELICAVFGLLSVIGRAAETARREDDREWPLPTTDLMGYGSLGIIFGPLLIGDMLDNYTMHLANHHGGLVLLPVSAPKSRKEKQKKTKSSEDGMTFNTHIDKIRIANSITEMLITYWRDVVHQMKDLKALTRAGARMSLAIGVSKKPPLRPSASEAFTLHKPSDWDNGKSIIRRVDRSMSPAPTDRHNSTLEEDVGDQSSPEQGGNLVIKKSRSKIRPMSSHRLSATGSINILSPTVEEQANETRVKPNYPAIPSCTSNIVQPNQVQPLHTTNAAQTEAVKCLSRELGSEPETSNSPQNHSQRGFYLSQRSTHSLPGKTTPGRQQLGTSLTEPPSPDVSSYKEPSETMKHVVSAPVHRIADSDPGQCSVSPTKTLLQPMKLNLGESRRQLAWTVSGGMDPLNKVSQEEDLASLAVLARVLSQEESADDGCDRSNLETPGKRGVEKNKHSSGTESLPRKSTSREKESCGSSPSPKPKPSLSPNRRSPGQTSSTVESLATVKRTPVATPNRSPKNNTPRSNRHIERSDETDTASLSKVPKKPHEAVNILQGSPRGTVRALTAKFNTASSALPSRFPSTNPDTKGPPNVPAVSESPRCSLVAPYMKNTPSPTKSQKSGISDKSIQTIRNPFSIDRGNNSSKDDITIGIPTPQRLLRSSLKDSKSLRPVRKSLEEIVASMGESLGVNNHAANRSRHIAISTPSKVIKKTRSYECTSGLANNGKLVPEPETSDVSYLSFTHPDATDPTGTAGLAQPQSSFCDAPSVVRSLSSGRPSLLPTRRNSVLHGQIRNLQQQLATKTEELQHLKQQLNARSNLDMRTLIESITEARREVQFWKSRAEVAEKQIEMMRKASVRSNSLQNGDCPQKSAAPSDQSSTKYRDDGGIAVGSIRRGPRGIDGAASSEVRTSEESSNTVVYEVQDAAIGKRENSSWMQQIMKALDTAGP